MRVIRRVEIGRFLQSVLASLALAAGLAACGSSDSDPPEPAGPTAQIEVASSRADNVSGGTALVSVTLTPQPADLSGVSITAGGTDVKSNFQLVGASYVGLISGLPDGSSSLVVRKSSDGTTLAQVDLVNHPITGPNFSGPLEPIFACETAAFGLGAPTDANCSAPTLVTYQYRTNAGAFAPYPTSGTAPTDVAKTILSDGSVADYIVRLESGVINRAVYQIAMLNAPGQPVPSPTTAAAYATWNKKLIYTFGGGCGGGHRQGGSTGGVINHVLLSKGYAVASSSLNVFGNDCSDVRSAETASMVKEYFIETFGRPLFTMGFGGSGGAMAQHLIATNYPGLLQGLMPSSSFPDTLTETNMTMDCSLLQNYFNVGSSLTWTDAEKTAVSGFRQWATCAAIAGPGTAPRGAGGLSRSLIHPKNCAAAVTDAQLYDATTNPTGARCTYHDTMVNVFGKDASGKARRPNDNAGVQYGLAALNAGTITAAQFIELNERVGGFDIDANYVPGRVVADPQALAITYTSGRVTDGVALGEIPIIDIRTYTDDLADVHDRIRTFILRQRITREHGDARNQAILTTSRTATGAGVAAQLNAHAVDRMDAWVTALLADTSSATKAAKVRAARPANLVDSCFDNAGNQIPETDVTGRTGACNALYPMHSDPRLTAGAPATHDVIKCQLKPLVASDYVQPLTTQQLASLQAAFPDGVCDFSKPGVSQAKVAATWVRY